MHEEDFPHRTKVLHSESLVPKLGGYTHLWEISFKNGKGRGKKGL